MKGNVLRRMLAVMLAMLLVAGMFSSVKAEAKELQALKVPTIKVKASGNSVKITINKTKEAEGYEVIIGFVGEINELYKDAGAAKGNWPMTVSAGKDKEGKKIEWTVGHSGLNETLTIEKDGKKKRTVTLKPLPAGNLTVKVRSYNEKKYGSKRYSEYSKEKTVTVKDKSSIGYKTEYDFSKAKKGDIIKFGAYEQDNDYTNGREAIEWIVLEKTKKSLLVISKYALDQVSYNTRYTSVTWETCTLRKWLNEKFYSKAFNKTEQGLIKTVTLENFDNPQYNKPGGNDTKDKVFLLSLFDMRNSDYGFSDEYDTQDENRTCGATAYAIAQGVYTSNSYKTKDGEDTCYWWLRSPGRWADDAADVCDSGSVRVSGRDVNYVNVGVRPALYINLK